MDMQTIAAQALKLTSKSPILYVRLVPEVLDFTIDEPGAIEVSTADGQVSIPFSAKEAETALTLLDHIVDDKTVISWNFKNLATLARFYAKSEITWAAQVRDILVIELFLTASRKKAPATFADAYARVMATTQDPCWRRLYKQVHIPLMSEAVPAMEASGLLSDVSPRGKVYPYYEVEGQRQGRLKTILNVFSRTYNPHSLGANAEVRPMLGENFLLFDYRNMEVAMLAWLSKDQRLQAILDSGLDVYETIWQFLVDQKPGPATRKLCKDIFLPVAYGMGETAVAEKLGNLEAARILMNAIRDRFSVAMGFLRSAQDSKAPNGLVRDYFERPRIFEDGSHKIRNFVIQAPAAMVCEERLVALHRAIRNSASLAFHVHDGYALTCPKINTEHVFALAKETLEAESPLCPGLRLKTSGKVGDRLDAMLAPPV